MTTASRLESVVLNYGRFCQRYTDREIVFRHRIDSTDEFVSCQLLHRPGEPP